LGSSWAEAFRFIVHWTEAKNSGQG
jgi:hypothetical protein